MPLDSDSALATVTSDGKLVIALWDYAPPTGTGPTYTMPTGPAGPARIFDLHLDHVRANAAIELWRVDPDHGNVLRAFDAMGRPAGRPHLRADRATARCGSDGADGGAAP